ncbi:MAG: heavy metal translocating P-type ATPase [Ruthenibacterium sp.]
MSEHNHAACACTQEHADAHDHAHGHEHGAEDKNAVKKSIFFIALALALVIGAYFVSNFWVALCMYLIAYLAVGREVLSNAFHNICRGEIFDENFLMVVATLGAFAIGDFSEAVAVMIFYNVGETLQDMAVAKSRANIASLMNIRPDFARTLKDGVEAEVAPETVAVGALILIKPGERVPLDCTVKSGEGAVDASALTGESMPIAASEGVALSSGSVNMNGVLTCVVTSVFADSTVQKILDLVSDASAKKASAEKFITRFAKIYTPCVMGAAALIAIVPPLFFGWSTFPDWFYRGLIFLVVSCPCALVISIPVSFLGGIGGAAKNGVLVKGSDVLDRLTAPKTIVFDKTGTLTQGKFAVSTVRPAKGQTEDTLLAAAALCERSSNHPIALSVRDYCAAKDSGAALTNYEEKAGYGVLATTKDGVYAAGNAKLMAFVGANLPPDDGANTKNAVATVLYFAKDGIYLGTIFIADTIKSGVKEAIANLRTLGVQTCYMLTGDNAAIAQSVADAVGLDGYKAGLLPHEKVAAFEALTQTAGGVSLYAGDGINDAPLLARADVGFAMGGVGSDAAIEAADVVLMTDEVGKIGSAIRIARQTKTIVKQNIIFALSVKVIVLILSAFGYTPMWLAIFADVGVALLAVANATRAIGLKG